MAQDYPTELAQGVVQELNPVGASGPFSKLDPMQLLQYLQQLLGGGGGGDQPQWAPRGGPMDPGGSAMGGSLKDAMLMPQQPPLPTFEENPEDFQRRTGQRMRPPGRGVSIP